MFKKELSKLQVIKEGFLEEGGLALDLIIQKGRKKGFSERSSMYNEHGLQSD